MLKSLKLKFPLLKNHILKYNNNLTFKKYSTKKMDSYFKVEQNNNDIILTPNEGYNNTIVFLHGLGDSAEGYKEFFLSQYKPIPDKMRVVLLTAPKASVTINGGMVMNSWYDIKNFNRTKDSIESSDVVKNAYRVKKVIDNEVKTFNGDYSKIFLGGFSQGACMTLHLGLTSSEKLGGLVVLSGLLFPFTAEELEKSKDSLHYDMPIFIAHGSWDELIQEPLAKTSYEPLKTLGFKGVNYKSYDEGHSIAAEEMMDMKEFLTKLI
jgi:phospholipase/carboxylesterase